MPLKGYEYAALEGRLIRCFLRAHRKQTAIERTLRGLKGKSPNRVMPSRFVTRSLMVPVD